MSAPNILVLESLGIYSLNYVCVCSVIIDVVHYRTLLELLMIQYILGFPTHTPSLLFLHPYRWKSWSLIPSHIFLQQPMQKCKLEAFSQALLDILMIQDRIDFPTQAPPVLPCNPSRLKNWSDLPSHIFLQQLQKMCMLDCLGFPGQAPPLIPCHPSRCKNWCLLQSQIFLQQLPFIQVEELESFPISYQTCPFFLTPPPLPPKESQHSTGPSHIFL